MSSSISIDSLYRGVDSFDQFGSGMGFALVIKEVLHCYDQGSGQRVNYAKKSKTELFASITDRGKSKVEGWQAKLWQAKLLSKAEKEILIKVVAQVIPSYAMQCFRFPVTLRHDLEALMAKFWWGSEEGKRKTHWVSWIKCVYPRRKGVLGFRLLVHMNTTLLAKQASRLVEDPGSMLALAYKRGTIRIQTSRMLRLDMLFPIRGGILQSKEVLRRGCKWILGDGNTVHIWQDSWVKGDSADRLISPAPLGFEQARVVLLMDIEGKRWDVDVVRSLLLPCKIELVLKMPFLDFDCPNRTV
ncbi:hypothetical protein LIER_14941 [Lithospermum erythrorhizon]|uniref:Uncharacterized protein n=1 Tax=Lithospermum erythrorhizon TaxID=34254 RepID=A0AAV3Q3D6_LITER